MEDKIATLAKYHIINTGAALELNRTDLRRLKFLINSIYNLHLAGVGVGLTDPNFSQLYKRYLRRFEKAKALIKLSNPKETLIPIQDPRQLINQFESRKLSAVFYRSNTPIRDAGYDELIDTLIQKMY